MRLMTDTGDILPGVADVALASLLASQGACALVQSAPGDAWTLAAPSTPRMETLTVRRADIAPGSIPWRSVRVYDGDGSAVGEPARALLIEYRRSGGIAGAWLIDPSRTDIDPGLLADLCVAGGPTVDDIDWSDIDDVSSL